MPTEDPASVLNEKSVAGEGVGCVFNRCLVFEPAGRGDAINGHMPQKHKNRQTKTDKQRAVKFFSLSSGYYCWNQSETKQNISLILWNI